MNLLGLKNIFSLNTLGHFHLLLCSHFLEFANRSGPYSYTHSYSVRLVWTKVWALSPSFAAPFWATQFVLYPRLFYLSSSRYLHGAPVSKCHFRRACSGLFRRSLYCLFWPRQSLQALFFPCYQACGFFPLPSTPFYCSIWPTIVLILSTRLNWWTYSH